MVFAVLIAVASAGVLPAAIGYAAQPGYALTQPLLKSEEYDPNPQYTFSYDIKDSLTGDSKNQIESRNGDVVQGQYSLIEADGTRRVVDYTADPIHGFNAVVRKEGLAVAPVLQKTIISQPALGYSAKLF